MSYPSVTQFETRDLRIGDELRLRAERQLDRQPNPLRAAAVRALFAGIFSGRERRTQVAGAP